MLLEEQGVAADSGANRFKLQPVMRKRELYRA